MNRNKRSTTGFAGLQLSSPKKKFLSPKEELMRKLVTLLFLFVSGGATLLLPLAARDASAQVGMADDGQSHPPPATGSHAYNSFVPGASYMDPVFGARVRRVTPEIAIS